MKPEWFETFFTPLAFDFWRAAVPSVATTAEVNFLVEGLGVSPPGRLLDLPSGSGRHALELARRGYDVTGIDLAPSEIAIARREAQARGLTPTFLVGDMRIPPPGGPYDGAYCFGNSFGYLSHPQMILFIRNLFGAVRSGGRWIIDSGLAAESMLPHFVEERRLEAGGITYTVCNTYDPVAGRLLQSCTLVRDAEYEHAEISYGIYTVAELHRMLQNEGWGIVATYGSLESQPFQLGDCRLLLVARHP